MVCGWDDGANAGTCSITSGIICEVYFTRTWAKEARTWEKVACRTASCDVPRSSCRSCWITCTCMYMRMYSTVHMCGGNKVIIWQVKNSSYTLSGHQFISFPKESSRSNSSVSHALGFTTIQSIPCPVANCSVPVHSEPRSGNMISDCYQSNGRLDIE